METVNCDESPLLIEKWENGKFVREIRSKSEQAEQLQLYITKEFTIQEICNKKQLYVLEHKNMMDSFNKKLKEIHIPKTTQVPTPENTSGITPNQEMTNSINLVNQLHLSTEQILNTFDYKTFYQKFYTGILECDDEKGMVNFVIQFFNNNLPKEIISKSEASLTDPNDPMVRFMDILPTKIQLRTTNDFIILSNFQAAISCYNVSHTLDVLDNLQLFQENYMTQYERTLQRILQPK